jgi:glucose-6-phosphate isomerase
VNLKESLVYVVSKSGTTAETVAAMAIIINELNRLGINEESFKDYFVFCTDPEKGELRKLSKTWNIKTLDIPSNIGGRFSVLTPVGFLPAFFAGINNEAILSGAKKIQKELSTLSESKSFFDLAFWIKSLHDKGVNQTVLMPYSSLLKDFSSWFVQLWAESLGKDGKGLTPIPAYGATDQHSQMQLFMEGPKDKIIFILEVHKHQTNYSLKNNLAAESFKNLSAFTLSDLMKAELEGTLTALSENDRHVVHLSITQLNEESVGQLVLFTECLTVMVGELLKVNPFNQPGVEAGKKYANEWLKNH